MIPLIIQDQFYTIQNLQRFPNVSYVKNDTKPRRNTLLGLVSFITEQTLERLRRHFYILFNGSHYLKNAIQCYTIKKPMNNEAIMHIA